MKRMPMNTMRIIVLIGACLSAKAQHVITIDWADKTMANAPSKVDQPLNVKLRITKVNDFLYSYEAKIKYDPNAFEGVTGKEMGSLASLSSALGCTVVDEHVASVEEAVKSSFTLPDHPKDKKYPSIPLAKSMADWGKMQKSYLALEAATEIEKQCTKYKEYLKVQPKLHELEKIARGPHEFSMDDVLPGDGKYTVSVNEFYGEGAKREVTEGGAYTATFYASTSRFFLTVGYLGSQLASRSYDTVVTGQDSKTTTNATTGVVTTTTSEIKSLRIQGTGAWRPTAAVLLNYKIPNRYLMGERYGFAVSAGPVYRIASSQTGSTATNWGVFAGLSFYLWERLVLTPGVHLGEFSDTPLGFHSGGNFNPIVPAGITTVSGVNRWSSRFGIGITFHAADFKKAAALATFASNPNPPATQTTAAPAVKPPPPVTPEVAPAKTPIATPDPATAAERQRAKDDLAAAEIRYATAKQKLSEAFASINGLAPKLAEAKQIASQATAAEKLSATKRVADIEAALDDARTHREDMTAEANAAKAIRDKLKTLVSSQQ